MLLGLISDTHLLFDNPIGRIDNAYLTLMGKFRYFIDDCAKMEIPILHAGDMFDVSRHWRLLAEYIKLFGEYKEYLKKYGIYSVFGQHDMYMRSDESKVTTNMGLLSLLGYIRILDEIPITMSNTDYGKVKLYGCSYGDSVPVVRDDGDDSTVNILVVHRKIAMIRPYPGAEDEYAINFIHQHKDFDLILCGDAHTRFVYETEDHRIICNAGCLIRKVSRKEFFDNPWDHKPGYYIYDTVKRRIKWIEIPHKPIDEVLSRRHLELSNLVEESISSLVEILGDDANLYEGDETEFMAILTKILKENKIRKSVVKLIGDTIDEEVKWKWKAGWNLRRRRKLLML